jgi:membrane-associated phospholipid phosphatase
MKLIIYYKFYFLIIYFIIINFQLSFTKEIDDSPYQCSFLLDGSILGAGIINGIAANSINHNITPLTIEEVNKLNKDDINVMDRWVTNNYSENISTLSDGTLGAAIIMPVVLFFDKDIRNDWLKISIMYSETILWSSFLPYYGKGLAQRLRPYAYNSDVPLNVKLGAETKRSFFSAHTCLAFSSAVFISKVYTDYFPDSEYIPYIWGGSALFAGVVGYLRIRSGSHFVSDVLTGAAVGSIVGYAVPYLHKKGKNPDKLSFQISPNYISLIYKL